ncbi:hypothetical protein CYMTET_28082 [Cymbomonas tetramitiformis]|uniref:Uncharacterized protein n=1 Tax=Cymbomonas tetramitiformis TaxID=36881 RepID=A0AAE0FNH5_9CHLO|nr:hypothetical protein CYMTET_28082 [Cymbomonas tetramitiformis]
MGGNTKEKEDLRDKVVQIIGDNLQIEGSKDKGKARDTEQSEAQQPMTKRVRTATVGNAYTEADTAPAETSEFISPGVLQVKKLIEAWTYHEKKMPTVGAVGLLLHPTDAAMRMILNYLHTFVTRCTVSSQFETNAAKPGRNASRVSTCTAKLSLVPP